MEKNNNNNKINRRDFFKLAGAGTLASATALYENYPYRTPTGKRLTILERVHIFSYLISFRKVIKELYSNRTKRFLPMDTFHNLRPARVSCRGVH